MFDEHVSEDTKVAMVKNFSVGLYPPNPLFMRQLHVDTSGQEVPRPTALEAYFTRSSL